MKGCPYLNKNGTQCGGNCVDNSVLCKKHQTKQTGGGPKKIPYFGIADSIASLFMFNNLGKKSGNKSK